MELGCLHTVQGRTDPSQLDLHAVHLIGSVLVVYQWLLGFSIDSAVRRRERADVRSAYLRDLISIIPTHQRSVSPWRVSSGSGGRSSLPCSPLALCLQFFGPALGNDISPSSRSSWESYSEECGWERSCTQLFIFLLASCLWRNQPLQKEIGGKRKAAL